MQIDFTKLQKLFIEKIKKEEGLILRGHDVSFQIEPNFEHYNLNVRIKVFGEEFSIGYPKENTTEEDLIKDFYSRLHDYNTDDAKYHIIRLKIQELEKRYREKIRSLRGNILSRKKETSPEDIFVNISDLAPNEEDERGFPKFEIFVVLKGKQVVTREIGFYEYNHKLVEDLENEIMKTEN